MKKVFLLLAFVLLGSYAATAQNEARDEGMLVKTMWARSVLNQQAPKIEVEKWLNGEPSLDGKYVLVEFWATWCGPCRKAIPKLNALQKEFSDKLVIIGISHEKESIVSGMISPKIEYTSAIDTREIMKTDLQVVGIPHAILINPKGVVVWEGFPQLPGKELTPALMKELLTK